MQMLAIIASILLLTATMVGSIGFSFAQESVNAASTQTNSGDDTTEPAPQKEMTMEEKIKAQLAEIKAKREAKMDDRVKAMKEKALKKTDSIDKLAAERIKKLEEKKEQHEAMIKKQKAMLEEQAAKKKQMIEQQLKKKISSSDERINDAKAKFDKKMQDKLAKFNAKVNLKSKTVMPQTEPTSEDNTESPAVEPSAGSN